MCATLVTATLAGGYSSCARAATWTLTPEASLIASYDDNVRLSPDAEVESASGIVDVRSKWTGSADDWAMSLTPHATIVRYEAQPVLDRNDWVMQGDVRRQTERSAWNLAGEFVRDTTLTSELGSTGLSEVNARHESVTANLGAQSIFNERWSGALSLTLSAHDYAEPAFGSPLVDYDYATAQVRTTYSTGERSSFSFDASFGRLTVPTQQANSENYAANVSYTSQLSQAWKISASVGPTRIESERLTDNGLGYSVSLERVAELITLSVSGSRAVTPTGRGVLSKRESAAVAGNMNLTERLRLETTLQWIRNRDVFPTLGLELDTVRYAQAEAGLRWRITSTVSAGVSVDWTRQQSETLFANRIDNTAEETRVRISLSWSGLQRSLH